MDSGPMDSTLLQESIRFSGSAALPGVQVMEVEQSSREWRIFNTQFSLAVSSTWQGKATYRGRTNDVLTGMLFCSEPGEIHTAVPTYGAGSFRVLQFDATVLAGYLAELGHARLLCWRKAVHTMSKALDGALRRIFRAVGPHANPMQLQSDVIELVHLLRDELIENPRAAVFRADADARVAQRIRECLHQEGVALDLETLSRRLGVSRFRVLRTFKRRYGLPPHAYQLCVRIALAQQLLRHGRAAADVAAECGFVDQSHLTRHFKRLIGLTPARYAQGASRGGSHLRAANPLALLARSDRGRLLT